MATRKYYAVRVGLNPGIYDTWEDARAQVEGFAGAEHRAFTKLTEAQMYMGLPVTLEPQGDPSDEEMLARCRADGSAIAYVDGSFNSATGEFAYGIVMFEPNGVHRHAEKYDLPDMAAMRNVAGEIKGAAVAMRFCYLHNIPRLTIYHDYEGIAKWCTGEWRAKLPGTQGYACFYKKISPRVKVTFVKVKGHSGDKYNDQADGLARSALGL